MARVEKVISRAGVDVDTNKVEHYSKSPILESVGISKVYKVGKQMISPVKDISLQIGYGDFVIIFGPSGAGKSTLMNILLGVEKPDIGEIFLKGDSFYEYNSEDRAKVRLKRFGIISQYPHWLDQLNVIDNVALPLILDGVNSSVANEKAKKLLALVNMEQFEKMKPSELSGGQQQKVSIARAMVNDPWIIFADEPTGHLDSQSVEEVIQILTDANRKEGKTIVMVTHDFQFLQYSKKWFFVKDGRLWDIEDTGSPFHNIKEVLGYIESGEKDKLHEKDKKTKVKS